MSGPACALALAMGCAGGGDGAAQECEIASCDIFDATCQAELMQGVACERGSRAASFDVQVTASPDEPAPLTPEQVLLQQRQMAALALFALAPEDWTQEQASEAYEQSVSAFYDPSTGHIVFAGAEADAGGDEPVTRDDPASMRVMAHELTHVLRDSETGLSNFYGQYATTFDRWLAARAITEGEAQLYAELVVLEVEGLAADDFDWDAMVAAQREYELLAFEQTPYPLGMADRYLVYSLGLAYVLSAWQQGGAGAVSSLFSQPPVSTRQLTAGYGEREPFGGAWSEDAELAEVAQPELLPGQETLGTFSLGVWLVDAFVQRTLDSPRHNLSWEVLSGMRADAITLIHDADQDAPLAVWRMRFANEELAMAMLELAPWPAHVRTSRQGRDAIFVATPSEAAQTEAMLAWTAPRVEGYPAAVSPTAPGRSAAAPLAR